MRRLLHLIILFLVLALTISSCDFPFLSQKPSVEGTPNATLTALFDTSMNVAATITPPVIITSEEEQPVIILVTATPQPTTTLTEMPVATSTSTTTSTFEPTVTSGVNLPAPNQRGNSQMVAKFLSTAPVQDGTYAEWMDLTNKYQLQYRVWGAGNWSGYSDLDAIYAAGWDSNYLYVGIKVTDDQYTQTKTAHLIYEGDEVEILIDTNLLGDFYTSKTDLDDYQFGLSAGSSSAGTAKEVYLWQPDIIKGSRSDVLISTMFETGPIYRIEAAIPWSALGVTPYEGLRLGFAVNVNDNDNVTEYKDQTMISTAAGLSVFNPMTWGELILLK